MRQVEVVIFLGDLILPLGDSLEDRIEQLPKPFDKAIVCAVLHLGLLTMETVLLAQC